MGIRINQISVSNYGPLGTCEFNFKKFNLIYGPNESGKTYLTEFLLRSIFKCQWSIRDLPGEGKVFLSGLDGDEITSFTPRSKKKIEDYWEDERPGLPANMARLLVVKGGELSLVRDREQTNREFLKSALSQQALFDKILKSIKPTIQNAEITSGDIDGSNRGQIKKRTEKLKEIKKINKLLGEIEMNYSLGPLHEKEKAEKALLEQISLQDKAKRHQAYILDKKIRDLKKEIVSEIQIQSLWDAIRDYEKADEKIERIQEDIGQMGDVEKEAVWLEKAEKNWGAIEPNRVDSPGKAMRTFGSLLISGGFLWGFIHAMASVRPQSGGMSLFQMIIAAVLFGIGFVLNLVYQRRLVQWSSIQSLAEERSRIIAKYSERFGELIESLTDLQTRLDVAKAGKVKVEELRRQLAQEELTQRNTLDEVLGLFNDLVGKNVPQDAWHTEYQSIKANQGEIQEEQQYCQMELVRLGVSKEDYLVEPAGEAFDEDRAEELDAELARIKDEVKQFNSSLDVLKQRACQETGDEIKEDWSIVLENVQKKLDEKRGEYKAVTAKIIAEIGVTKILDSVMEEEEDKIRQNLQSPEVTSILSEITQRYTHIDINGDDLSIIGKTGDYDVSALSTGAREQVFLALRMGFASKFAGGNPLFIIFDDAFQHSDWDRRDRLINIVFNFIELGWQVTYLTMDDHIRDQCKELGEKKLGEEFQFYSLENN